MRHACLEFWQIRPILEAVAGEGVDIARILARRGLGPGLDDTDPHHRLGIVDYFRIQNEIALALDDLTAQLIEQAVDQENLNLRTAASKALGAMNLPSGQANQILQLNRTTPQ